jgi:hypothetical protein
MYVCMFRHNYLSVNGIVSFPSFTWLYKYKEEYKQGEMWHSAQRPKISEEICMFQPGRSQATDSWLISVETNNEELLIARQLFRNHGYIDGNSWSRRLWKESYRQLQESSRRESTICPGNAGESASGLQYLTPKPSSRYIESGRWTREGRAVGMKKTLNGAVLKIRNCGGVFWLHDVHIVKLI